MDCPEQNPTELAPQEVADMETLEKIRDRTNKIISSFFEVVRSDEVYNKTLEEAKEEAQKLWQIEASSLMQAIAAISTSVILSINNKGIDINELINDHFRSVNTYLKQSIQTQAGQPQEVEEASNGESTEEAIKE